jgi:tetratricopeptide (TPR) repeat protein
MGKSQDKRQLYLICALLVVITVTVYWQVAGFDFTNFDDNRYIKINPRIAQGLTLSGIRWSLTATYEATWIPLVWMSYMVDHDISSAFADGDVGGGADPSVCHITNLLLHIANVLLLFIVLRWMTGRSWLSAFVAALFAVHPLHVESVAWVAERKDVLSTLFWLLTMLAYIGYSRKPHVWRYALVVLAYALGLMCKPMLVSLPLVLLLLDYWPLDRANLRWRLVWEKAPLLAMSVFACVITFVAQRSGGAVVGVGDLPLVYRVENAAISYVAYVVKMVWPAGLAALYPLEAKLPIWQVVGSIFVLAAATILALRNSRRRPYLAVGWLWYLITLVPVIGLMQVGRQAMADRYSYIPLTGLFIAVAWGASDLLKRLGGKSGRPLAVGLAVGLIAALMVRSYIQVGYWRDSYTLFTHAIRVTGPNAEAHHNLGGALLEMGETNEALVQYRESLRIDPDNPDLLYGLAFILYRRGSPADLDEAIELFYALIRIKPGRAAVHNDLGTALAKRGRLDAAISQFDQALRLNPESAEARLNLYNAVVLREKAR